MLGAGRAGVFNVGVSSALLGAAERCSSDEDDECFVACRINAHFVPRGILRVGFPKAPCPPPRAEANASANIDRREAPAPG